MRPSAATLVFRSYDAAMVSIEECLGQISDGKYERRTAGSMKFFKLGGRVDPDLRRSGLGGRVEKSPPVRFTDLACLFDARPEPLFPREDPTTDVRNMQTVGPPSMPSRWSTPTGEPAR